MGVYVYVTVPMGEKEIEIKLSGRFAQAVWVRCPDARDPNHPQYIQPVFELSKEQVEDVADRLYREIIAVDTSKFQYEHEYNSILSDHRKAYMLKHWVSQAEEDDTLFFA